MESKQPDRVIIDTNLWISFLITRSFSKIDHLITSNKLRLVFSKELLSEFIDVSGRPKLQKYFEVTDLVKLLDSIDNFSETISVRSKINICRDVKDNFLLSLAVDSKADYILTGDKDLLVLKKIAKTKIVTVSQYLNKR